MNAQLNESFPGFKFHSSDMQKYIRAGDIFTIMLKDGRIIHHTLQEQDAFEEWLKEHAIINIRR